MNKNIKLKIIRDYIFRCVEETLIDGTRTLALVADMCRLNAITAVKRAGSGHLGSSFSSMDILVHLYYAQMNTRSCGITSNDRDIFFSSKGHDAPGLYSVLYSLGLIEEQKFLHLRRLNGLHGHPDVSTPGIEANSGSLGMGISKGRGMAWAKQNQGFGGRVFVLTGDGELQEGQNYEALQGAASHKAGNLTVIVDHNKVQSDKFVQDIMDLGVIEERFKAFGWFVKRCDGHDHIQLSEVFSLFAEVDDRPKVLIADTIKGKGVSFMEHPSAMSAANGYYKWHAGAPDDSSYVAAFDEILSRVNEKLASLQLAPLTLHEVLPDGSVRENVALDGEPESRGDAKISMKASAEFVADAYGESLLEIAARRKDIVVLDADLAADCRVRPFELAYPERFIECGIAEQDMVSMAGGLARQGLLPVVNSFACFLMSRANEQIYNNASEKTKIIYAAHYAGMIPAGPGKSHQSIRDIALVGSLPNMLVVQPCNAAETKMVLEYAVDVAQENVSMRLCIGPSPRRITLPQGYSLQFGCGVTLREGDDAVLIAYGPVMLHEALLASEILAADGVGLKVVNMPWLNRVDRAWLEQVVEPYGQIFVLDDHAPVGGLGDYLITQLANFDLLHSRNVHCFAVEGYPACGTPPEALAAHKLDGASLAERIRQRLK